MGRYLRGAVLSPRIAAGQAPDLTWLRSANLADQDVARLATDSTTHWSQLQRRALLAEDLPPDIQAIIGMRIDDIKVAPTGTTFWTPKKGTRQLRWQSGHDAGHPSLTLDSRGRVVVGGADDLNRASLSRNMRLQSGRLFEHQDHHIVPIAVARDHQLFRLARSKGGWDPNHPSNGIQLPASSRARAAVHSSQGLPLHNSSHKGYSQQVSGAAEEIANTLRAEYGILDRVPAARLTAAADQVTAEMRSRLYRWTLEQGDRLQ